MLNQSTSFADDFVNDTPKGQEDIAYKETIKHQSSGPHKAMNLIEQRVLVQEGAEVQGASLLVYNHMKEIEVLIHRLVVCAPYYSANNPRVKTIIEDWTKFTERQWRNMQELSVMDNPLGA